MRQGEKSDANLRPIGFDLPGFDDKEWENAVIAHEPGGILQTTQMPPIRVIRTLTPVVVDGDVYDFGITFPVTYKHNNALIYEITIPESSELLGLNFYLGL